jgi:hypothetical protein
MQSQPARVTAVANLLESQGASMQTKTLRMMCAIAVFSFTVLADDGHGKNGNNGNNGNDANNSSFESSVIGSVPALAVGGVVSGGVLWVVQTGETSVSPGGRIHVEVHGLLIGQGAPSNLVGTTGPVTMVGATLICGGAGGTPVPASGGLVTPAPLSASGNAEIDQTVNLPSACFAPVVLVRVFTSAAPLGSQLGAFIAVSGLTPNAAQNQNQNNDNKDGHGDGGQHL